ncbi:MAG: hypothetical protein AAF518_28550 [Spirochaetota bacterium]
MKIDFIEKAKQNEKVETEEQNVTTEKTIIGVSYKSGIKAGLAPLGFTAATVK